MKASSYHSLQIRGTALAVRSWGTQGSPVLLMLHGIQDTSATFQFVVDCLQYDWHIIAPDFRGHGRSEKADAIWFHDLVADVDLIAHRVVGDAPVSIVAHSMGANVACLLAASQPDRVARLVTLDAMGPMLDRIESSPIDTIQTFLSQVRKDGFREAKRYRDVKDMARSLIRANPNLDHEKARWLASQSARTNSDGTFSWAYDVNLGRSISGVHGYEEWQGIWGAIRCPLLWIASGDTNPRNPSSSPAEIARRLTGLGDGRIEQLAGTSHNLHHEEPHKVARLIEAFMLDI